MRLLKHAGRPSQPRRVIAEARSAGNWRVRLAPGVELAAGFAEALAARGVAHAAIQLLGGSFDSLELRSGRPDGGGAPLSGEGEPRLLQGPLLLIGGNGILGRDSEGGPLLHCRAVAVDREGRLRGGRLRPGGCRVGAEGLAVLVTALAGAGFAAVHDAETGVTLFEPESEVA